jgi:hypothetical protein
VATFNRNCELGNSQNYLLNLCFVRNILQVVERRELFFSFAVFMFCSFGCTSNAASLGDRTTKPIRPATPLLKKIFGFKMKK